MLGHKFTSPPRAVAAAIELSSSVIRMLFATALQPSIASSVTCAQPHLLHMRERRQIDVA
jgi:hypothetical protein